MIRILKEGKRPDIQKFFCKNCKCEWEADSNSYDFRVEKRFKDVPERLDYDGSGIVPAKETIVINVYRCLCPCCRKKVFKEN